MRWVVWISVIVGCCLTPVRRARGDEIEFKNGDRISGTIVSADGGKMVVNSKLAGTLTVNIADIKTFSADHPIKIRLKDGTLLEAKVVAAGPGKIEVETKPVKQAATTRVASTQRASTQVAATRVTSRPVEQPIVVTVGAPIELGEIVKINEQPPKWTGQVVFNGQFVHNAGSSEQFGFTAVADRKTDTDPIHFDGAYLYGRSKSPGEPVTTDADNWFIEGNYDHFFTKKFYGYLDGRVEEDRVNFLDLRLTPGMGAGYQWIASPDFNFKTEAGLAYVYERFGNGGGTDDGISARAAYHVDKNFFNGHLNVYNDTQYLPALNESDNYLILTTMGAKTPITDKLFSSIELIVNYDSNPAPGARRTDERLLVGVGYKF